MSAAPPATISTTMVSPMTRLKPSITPVAIPEKAAGIVTVVSVSQCVAPSADRRNRHESQQDGRVQYIQSRRGSEVILKKRCKHCHPDKADNYGRHGCQQLNKRFKD